MPACVQGMEFEADAGPQRVRSEVMHCQPLSDPDLTSAVVAGSELLVPVQELPPMLDRFPTSIGTVRADTSLGMAVTSFSSYTLRLLPAEDPFAFGI